MIRSKKGKGTPAISTSSLPDIVFMLLFFFMVVTVMRETEQKVEVIYPKATELTKLERRSLVSHIYIGPPTGVYRKKFGDAPRVQLDDAIAEISDIRDFIRNNREDMDENLRRAMITSLKVDAKTQMGIIYEVKQELRKAKALKINYSTVVRTQDL